METINDVLSFLNQMEMFIIMAGVEYHTFNNIRKILIDEFNNVDLEKLVEMLATLDDLRLVYLRNDVNDKSSITSLTEKIFTMYDQKMLK